MRTSLIVICLNCDFRQRPCVGGCACKVDGVDIKEHVAGGTCPKGFYGEAAAAQPMTLATVAHGVKGIAKALAGIDHATDEVRAMRTGICEECEHAVRRLGLFYQCDLCKCATALKILNAKEKCPISKW